MSDEDPKDELERLRKENEANADGDSQWICLAAVVLSSLEHSG